MPLTGIFALALWFTPSFCRAAAPPEAPPEQPDPRVVDTLLRAERMYDEGLDEIKAGRVLEGKQAIGQAFVILSSVLEEERLSGELHDDFEDMLDDIRGAELEPPEAPELDLQEQGLKTPPAFQASAATAPAAYEITIDTASKAAQKYLAAYASRSRRPRLLAALERSGRFRPMIEKALREAGLPRELLYLVMVESEFNPKAFSRAGAAGLWQLMPGTARRLGLEVNYWVDERFDPEKSTAAALKYLKDLHDWFGDWSLALAAYNRGEHGIAADMSFSKATRFDQLSARHALPRETNDYMPKFAACVLVGETPGSFGLEPRYQSPEPYDTVTVDKALDIEIAAKCAGAAAETIRALNPRLRAWCTPDDHPGFTLRIPAGTREAFLKNLAGVADWNPARALMRYRIERGDTLGRIALKFRTTPRQIMAENKIANPRLLRPGKVLDIRPGRSLARRYRRGRRRIRRGKGRKI